MQQVVYPAIVNFDDQSGLCYIAVYDVGIFAEGATIEEVFLKASTLLLDYANCSLEINGALPMPSTFEDYKSKYPNDTIVLVKTTLSDSTIKKYARDVKNLYVDIEAIGDGDDY